MSAHLHADRSSRRVGQEARQTKRVERRDGHQSLAWNDRFFRQAYKPGDDARMLEVAARAP
jgi:hypothetical protein